MTGAILALGVSHKTASLPVREKLALPEGRAVSVLRELVGHTDVHEAVAISTCNRSEVYLVVSDAVEAESATLAILARQAGIPPTDLLGTLYALRDDEAVRHLFHVAAGLDSMIVGEAEVQGQVKRAYELALVEGVTGPVSNRLFRDALGAGKRVRTETAISRAHVSVSSSTRAACSSSVPARTVSSRPAPCTSAAHRPCSSPTAATTAPSVSRSDSVARRSASRTCRGSCSRPTSS
jgi:glutamyl-tRNA reductase